VLATVWYIVNVNKK